MSGKQVWLLGILFLFTGKAKESQCLTWMWKTEHLGRCEMEVDNSSYVITSSDGNLYHCG